MKAEVFQELMDRTLREKPCLLCGGQPEHSAMFYPFRSEQGNYKAEAFFYALCGECKALPEQERNERVEEIFRSYEPPVVEPCTLCGGESKHASIILPSEKGESPMTVYFCDECRALPDRHRRAKRKLLEKLLEGTGVVIFG